jgi:hypothetical protein
VTRFDCPLKRGLFNAREKPSRFPKRVSEDDSVDTWVYRYCEQERLEESTMDEQDKNICHLFYFLWRWNQISFGSLGACK